MQKVEPTSVPCVRSLRVGWPLYDGAERLARTIAFLTPYRGLFHEAALFTEYGHGYFPVECQRPRLPQIREALARFRELGWSAGVNVLSTVGHFCEAPQFHPAMPVPPMTDCDGAVAVGVACPRSVALLAETRERYRIIAECGPEFIWVDDDIKLTYIRGLKPSGCFCDTCLRAFAEQTGRPAERAALAAEIRRDTWPAANELRMTWIRFAEDAYCRLLAEIERAVHAVDQHIELGLMGGDPLGFSGDGVRRMVEALAGTAAGVRIRPGGGFFFDDIPGGLLKKAFSIGRNIVASGPRATSAQAEVENFPYMSLLKTPRATVLESFADLAAGCTGLAYNILPYLNDEEQAVPLLTALQEAGPVLDRYRRGAAGLPWRGLHVVRSHEHQIRARYDDWPKPMNDDALFAPVAAGPVALPEMGLPFTSDPSGAAVTILTEPAVTALTDEELLSLLSRPVIVDAGGAARILDRGLGEHLGVALGTAYPAGTVERLLDHPVNAGIVGSLRDARTGFLRGPAQTLILADGAEGIAEHVRQETLEPLGPCAALFRNRLGGRVVTLAYQPWAFTQSVAKHRQWRQLLGWLAPEEPLAWVEDVYRICPFVRTDGERWSVLLINASMEPTSPLRLHFSLPVTDCCCYGLSCDEEAVPAATVAGGSRVELPAMSPWSPLIVEVESLREGVPDPKKRTINARRNA